ncbi:2599_t:CDS:2 [Acaulospora colombiana]|uniref:2599_t:CDS:1 n=1 Tax=Acaulospora colombiana TaxID=27376 RepID=A0ACA9LEF3_9GLOM|nr:2599_t:CDS:2 [Acaulospora colombiana]
MQQHDGLAVIYYPTVISRKKVYFQTWLTQYHLKRRHSFLDESLNAQLISMLSRPPSSHSERSVVGRDGFSKVPHEIMMNIMEYLEPTEIISLSMVNRKLRAHTHDNYLWKQILLREFGETAIQEEPRQVNTKGKWKKSKSARKQVPTGPNWKKVFMRLLNVSTKTAIFKGRPGSFYKYRNFDHKDNDHNIYLSSYERESKFYYAPNPDDFSHVIDKGWFNFRLPFKVVISKKEHSDEYRYQVHTGINCDLEDEQNNGRNSSSITKNKGPFSVDSVCLRPHIAYDLIRASSPTPEENHLLPDSLSAEIDHDSHVPDESVYSDTGYSECETQTSVDGDVRSYTDHGSYDNGRNERRWSRESSRKKEYIKKVFLCSGSDVYVE